MNRAYKKEVIKMRPTIGPAVRALLATDATITADTVEKVINILNGGAPGAIAADEPISAGRAAKLLKCTTRTVMRYRDKGLIKCIGGRGNGVQTRYSLRSVLAFLNGEAAA